VQLQLTTLNSAYTIFSVVALGVHLLAIPMPLDALANGSHFVIGKAVGGTQHQFYSQITIIILPVSLTHHSLLTSSL